MFLSQAVVPVFVFTIMLNFFYLYTPISSETTPPPATPPPADPASSPNSFPSCEKCQESPCYKETNGTCGLDKTNTTFNCFTCVKNETTGVTLYYTEDTCKTSCTEQGKECVCGGPCYSCIDTATFDKSSVTCDVPTMMVDAKCQVVAYVPPTAPA